MTILLTGAAGFIGFHVAKALLAQGEQVVGMDNLNSYYDPALKCTRVAEIERAHPGKAWRFLEADIADSKALREAAGNVQKEISSIIHLAAQAGVRYSITHPEAYGESNLVGQLNILEYARHAPKLEHFVYASSSSVYGANTELPFSIQHRVEKPVSLYAATKRAGELMAYTYSHLYEIPATGLRFFTVYGPWGRPDMAYYSFTRDILSGNPIRVFGNGELRRDFTYIDDIVEGVLSVCKRVPKETEDAPSHRLYNLGNDKSERLMDFIQTLEGAVGKKAQMKMEPIPPGDVIATHADITESRRDFGYSPKTTIGEGLPRFVEWYKKYHKI